MRHHRSDHEITYKPKHVKQINKQTKPQKKTKTQKTWLNMQHSRQNL
jgi:hypothetical protein